MTIFFIWIPRLIFWRLSQMRWEQTGEDYTPETMEYIRLMGRLNCLLAERASEVVEVVYGIPVVLKGEKGK